jgi:DNA-binding Lrp family transcriptional regulator
MKKLNDVDYKIISELIKNSRISDRKLASTIGISQPTVSRRRHKLEKEGLLDFTATPNFSKLGFEIMVFSFYSWTPEATEELIKNQEEILQKLSEFLSKHKNIIFTSNGRGFGMERMMISVHKSYSDYIKLTHDVGLEWGKYLSKGDSFIISLQEDVVGRQLTFEHFAEYIDQNR